MKLPSLLLALTMIPVCALAQSEKSVPIPRCQVVPLPDQQVSFRIDGVEKTRWHFGKNAPRPFFYPFRGPSGAGLTRMGHPGAPNHDHHRSIWFAHNQVNGIDFWSDKSREADQPVIRQTQWYVYDDGNEQATTASALLWSDKDGRAILKQDLVATMLPLKDGEFVLELQLTFTPADQLEKVELGKTNFGFLAVRVAKSISAHFGGGAISNDKNLKGEKAIFGKASSFVDYSGPVAAGKGENRRVVQEGITCFDHPANSADRDKSPASWHVRDDGWMGPSVCRHGAREVTRECPLTLRYLLHSHRGVFDEKKAREVYRQFLARPGFEISKSTEPHRQFKVRRKSESK